MIQSVNSYPIQPRTQRKIANYYWQSKLQSRYETHRSMRNANYKVTILSRDFPGWNVDEILSKLHAQKRATGDKDEAKSVDPRNNIALYARPPQHIRELVDDIQRDLQDVAPC